MPGVVDQDDLDAKWINVVPAVGVLIVLVLSLAARRQPPVRHARGDLIRIVIASLAVAVAIPWIAAALGFFLDGTPVLGSIFQTERVVTFHGNAPHHAVHHGMHHGLYGLVLIVSALLLSRRLPFAPRIAAALLALLLAYGIGNIVNDDWLEQIAERGWTHGTFPVGARAGRELGLARCRPRCRGDLGRLVPSGTRGAHRVFVDRVATEPVELLRQEVRCRRRLPRRERRRLPVDLDALELLRRLVLELELAVQA